MKKSLVAIAAVFATLGVSQLVIAAAYEDEIAQRLEPVGEVCIQGEPCAAETQGQAVATAGGNGGKAPEAIYEQSCSTCHAVGVAGAPKFGVVDEWAPRIEKGIDALYASVLNGLPPGMPAKGMCFTCSEAELKAVTDYMVAQAQE